MRALMRWVAVTVGLGALWMVTRAVVFYFVGVVAVFATAFQATVNALSRLGEAPDPQAEPVERELRVHRDARVTAGLIDLTDGARESVLS